MPSPIRLAPLLVVALLVGGCTIGDAPSDPGTPPTPTVPPAASPTAPASVSPTPTPGFDPQWLSIDDPASLWVISNKLRPLRPLEYEPPDLVRVPVPHSNTPMLRREAAEAVVALFAAFRADTGLELQSLSAYRSYRTQVEVYNRSVRDNGQAYADRSSARPGHSEHQTGLSLDIGSLPARCAFDACFGDTEHGRWLAANAWRHGFVLRYPDGKTEVTGFKYEPWHFRYVGLELAAELHRSGAATLEEFFGLPPAPDYSG